MILRTIIILPALVVLLGAGAVHAEAGDLKLSLKASLASLYDTNVHRTYKIEERPGEEVRTRPVEADVALKALLRARARGRLASWAQVAAQYDFGAKHFINFDDEDVFVNRLEGQLQLRLAAPLVLEVAGEFKDKKQRGGAPAEELPPGQSGTRDYRVGGAELELRWTLGPVTLRARGRYTGLEHKPDHLGDYSYDAGAGLFGGELAFLGAHRVYLFYELQGRVYDGSAVDLVEAGGTDDRANVDVLALEEHREDLVHRLSLGYRWQGPVLLGVGYIFEANRSNSAGESYLKHRASLLLSARLPGDFLLNVLGNLQYKTLTDGFYLSGRLPLQDEDENQNNVAVKLTRELAPWISMEFQAAHYWNEFSAGEVQFSRTALSLGVAGRWE